MTDRIIDKAWSDVQPGDFIRFATPRFIRYGRVISHPEKSDSIRVDFLGGVGEKAIPNARWYFVQGKLFGPNAEEHLFVVEPSPEEPIGPGHDKVERRSHQAWITVAAACEMMKMDQKQLRRHIRRGVVVADKRDGIWYIDKERLRDAAAKFGWV